MKLSASRPVDGTWACIGYTGTAVYTVACVGFQLNKCLLQASVIALFSVTVTKSVEQFLVRSYSFLFPCQ